MKVVETKEAEQGVEVIDREQEWIGFVRQVKRMMAAQIHGLGSRFDTCDKGAV